MEQILLLLEANDVEGAIGLLMANEKDIKSIEAYKKEHDLLDRKVRPTQAGKVQLPKQVKNAEGEVIKQVNPIIIPIPYQNKIVSTATAFEVGRPPHITPSEENDLSQEVLNVWRDNRVDSKLQELVKQKKAYTESAILFYITEYKEGFFNRLLNRNVNKDIKSRVLNTNDGRMCPYFDANGNMVFFTWIFNTTVGTKVVSNKWVYSDKLIYQSNNSTGTFISTKVAHGFSKIPIVYTAQERPEWFTGEQMIDRIEVSMSKLANSNNYSAHPILKTVGVVNGLPDKDEDGKIIACDIDVTENGQIVQSDASYLTHDNAPASSKLEIETLEKNIYALTSTPDLSFDNLKGLGNLSGVALKLMFLDPTLKAQMNEGENRTMVSRIINVIVSGILTTTAPGLKAQSAGLHFDIKFMSVLPDDLKTTIAMLTQAVSGKIMSQKTAVEMLGLVDNVDDELAEIEYRQQPQ